MRLSKYKLVFALSAALPFGDFSQGPSPGAWKGGGSPPQAQATKNTQPANSGEPSPSRPTLIVASQQQPRPAEHADNSDGEPPSEWWMISLTFLVFVAAAAQVVATVVIVGTTRRQLRAYVFPDAMRIFNVANPIVTAEPTDARITRPADGPGITMTIKNFGQTPAYDVLHWRELLYAPYPLPAPLTPPEPTNASRIGLPPGASASAYGFLPSGPLTEAQKIALRSGTAAIYLFGRITYRDAFGKDRQTDYRHMHHFSTGILGISVEMSVCDNGNNAT